MNATRFRADRSFSCRLPYRVRRDSNDFAQLLGVRVEPSIVTMPQRFSCPNGRELRTLGAFSACTALIAADATPSKTRSQADGAVPLSRDSIPVT